MSIKSLIINAPDSPGIYQMMALSGDILYIGKAKNIKKRLQNYIGQNLTSKTLAMLRLVTKIEYIKTANESQALLLESRLVKKFQPKYNILLKDDKSFPYIRLRLDHEFPQVTKYRGKLLSGGDKFFGPFANVAEVNSTIKFLHKTFKLRNCSDAYFQARKRPCLQYQIGRCSAPCVGKISKAEYEDSINQALAFLSGKGNDLQHLLAMQMEELSNSMEYEKAAAIRDRIKNLSYIQLSNNVKQSLNDLDVISAFEKYGSYCVCICFYRSGQNYGHKLYFPSSAEAASLSEVLSCFIGLFYQNTPSPKEIIVNSTIEDTDILEEALFQLHGTKVKITTPVKGEKKILIDESSIHAMEGLEQRLKQESTNSHILEEVARIFSLEHSPKRIEIYDNSHIMGSHAVGAMVVATTDGFDKKAYRTYNVENKTGDDYAMLREVMTRRMKRIILENAAPDLMIIDGGKGHLSTAKAVMEELGLELPIVAMSKGIDRNAGNEIFHMLSGREFTLDKNDQTMKYLQILRDEAHNFAITSHRKKRSKAIYFSSLDDIPNIGAARKKSLLNYFGGIDAIKAASIDELAKVEGISKALAEKIFGAFH